MLGDILFYLVVIVAIETLYTIFFDERNDENVVILLDDYKNSKPSELRTMAFYESDEYEYITNENILVIPSYYDKEEINECYLLLNEYSDCLDKNEYNYVCKKLIEEKLSEFEKCDLIYSSYSSISPSSSLSSIEDKKDDIKYNINDIFGNIEDDDDLKYLKSYNNNEDEIEIEEMNNKKEKMIQEIIKESFIMKNDKDCVEYELSEEDENVIKCAKYE